MSVIHTIFDILSITLALAGGWLAYKKYLQTSLVRTAQSIGGGYFISIMIGSLIGSYGLGTYNLYLSDIPEIGRSILGALVGAIVMVELYKVRKGVQGSTGYIYIIPFCICVIVGRLGCFFAGLPDNTYGTPTQLPWGCDFGDGVSRHPVQLYESLSMLLFLLGAIILLSYRQAVVVRYGFYICVGFYGLQRFLWEFLKPYQKIDGNMDLFQYACIALIFYSFVMIVKVRNDSRAA